MIKDLKNNLSTLNALDAATIATDTTTNGIAIDTQGYESGVMNLRVGTFSDGTYTLGVEESDASGSGYTDIPAARIVGTALALAGANEHDSIGFVANKRYVRATILSASTSSGADITASCSLGAPNQGPVATHTAAD